MSTSKYFIPLTPVQSVKVHGWWNPKRTLCWEDITKSDWITVELLRENNISQSQLMSMQPDVYKWIQCNKASFQQVPYMVDFPLHPIMHLHGDISTLIQYEYPPATLKKIGIDYDYLCSVLKITPQWMAMFRFTVSDWIYLGLTKENIDAMNDQEVQSAFGLCKTSLSLSVDLYSSVSNT